MENSRLPSMTGDQVDNELMDFFNSSLQAIQNARLSRPLGAPYTSLQSYVPLTGLINAIAQSILANDCTCSPS